MFRELRDSLPAITDALTPARRAFFDRLPPDYQQFLAAHNGGYTEFLRYTFMTGVPYVLGDVDVADRGNCVAEFFGLNAADVTDSTPCDLVQQHEFHTPQEVLPRDVIVIARCVENSLVCLSLRDDDRGAIYYWERHWRYPWCREFFEARIEAAESKFADADTIAHDRVHPQFAELTDARNFATLLKLADSFTAWPSSCLDERKRT